MCLHHVHDMQAQMTNVIGIIWMSYDSLFDEF